MLWIARPVDRWTNRAKFIALSIFLNNSAQRATINASRPLPVAQQFNPLVRHLMLSVNSNRFKCVRACPHPLQYFVVAKESPAYL